MRATQTTCPCFGGDGKNASSADLIAFSRRHHPAKQKRFFAAKGIESFTQLPLKAKPTWKPAARKTESDHIVSIAVDTTQYTSWDKNSFLIAPQPSKDAEAP